jgi:hypothetical protein
LVLRAQRNVVALMWFVMTQKISMGNLVRVSNSLKAPQKYIKPLWAQLSSFYIAFVGWNRGVLLKETS